jgi:hypothetical protein
VVLKPGNKLVHGVVGLVAITTVGNGLTVKVAIPEVCAAQGAAPVTIQRY